MPKKEITPEDIIHFSVSIAEGAGRLQLIQFYSCLQACADFLDGFLEFAKKNPKDEMIEPVLGEICQALMDFNVRKRAFNEYVDKVATGIMMSIPEVQEMIANKYLKPNTTKS